MSAVIIILLILTIFLALVVVLGALAWNVLAQATERRREPLIEDARMRIVATVTTGRDEHDAAGAVGKLKVEEAVPLLLDLGRSISGTSQDTVAAIALESGIVHRAQRDLNSRWWWRRLYATRLLTTLSPHDRAYVDLLDDPAPEIRAQAAKWMANDPNPEAIYLLSAMLNDTDGLCRFAAQSALVSIGTPAVPEVGALLGSDRSEIVLRALPVATAIGDASFITPLLRLTTHETDAVRAGAAEALGHLADDGAEEALKRLLTDHSPEVRRAATRSLGLLACWPTAQNLEVLLDDDVVDVRRHAGAALANLGPTGRLLLRSVSRRSNRSGAAARHVLDLEQLNQNQPSISAPSAS